MNEAETHGLGMWALELLQVLTQIVAEDARRLDHEIKQALTTADNTALRRVLDSDPRLAAWIRAKETEEVEHRALPSGYQVPPSPRTPVSGATVYTCLTPDCTARYLRAPQPRTARPRLFFLHPAAQQGSVVTAFWNVAVGKLVVRSLVTSFAAPVYWLALAALCVLGSGSPRNEAARLRRPRHRRAGRVAGDRPGRASRFESPDVATDAVRPAVA